MSAIIIGGNECMVCTYCDLCAKYNITARTIPLKKGSFANQLGKPDYIFVCMDHRLPSTGHQRPERSKETRIHTGPPASWQRLCSGARADPRYFRGIRRFPHEHL